jgi:hypothetical protein
MLGLDHIVEVEAGEDARVESEGARLPASMPPVLGELPM